MRRLFIVLVAALAGMALAAPADTALADPPGHAKGGKGGKGKGGHKGGHGHHSHHGGSDVEISLHFGDHSRGLIVDFYGRHPGMRKKYKPLPPGIRKNLAVGKPLPPGLAKEALPEELELSLPPLREGYARFVVGDTLVVVEVGSGVVIDIFAEF